MSLARTLTLDLGVPSITEGLDEGIEIRMNLNSDGEEMDTDDAGI